MMLLHALFKFFEQGRQWHPFLFNSKTLKGWLSLDALTLTPPL